MMKLITKCYERAKTKTRELFNPFLGPIRQKMALASKGQINSSFTIISNNCWGGHVYRYFNLPYNTPTIGLYIFSDDYIKFIYNLHYYCQQELQFINYTESRYRDILKRRGGKNITCPIARLADIEIVFLHYKTIEEAKTKWEKRSKRINYDKLYFKMSQQNLCTEDLLKRFDSLPYPNKFVFVTKDYRLKSQVIFKKFINKEEVSNDTVYFRKYVNLIKFIKREPFYIK